MQKIGLFGLMVSFCCTAPSFAAESACSVESVVGTYERHRGKGYLPSTLIVKRDSASEQDVLDFELESYWSAKPNDDGSHTSQALFAGNLQLQECLGLYVSNEENDNCQLVVQFSSKSAKVTHFGDCLFIGVNAAPDGVYGRIKDTP